MILDNDATYQTKLVFGEQRGDDGSSYVWNASFDKETIKKTAKITGLSKHIQFYCPKQPENPDSPPFPLLIKVMVGAFGSLSIFIRDKDVLELEQQNSEGTLSY